MQNPARLLLVLLFFAVALHAQPSLDSARHAQALLGPETWSQIIRVENEARRSRYPRIVHALVFELNGVLWFYTDADGTQSFSLHVNNLVAEKADFAPLLRAIEPGFVRWSVVPPEADEPREIRGSLLNGCFIESVAELRQRLQRGDPTEEPRLLAYYANASSGRLGHSVLAYFSEGKLVVFDPARRDERLVFSRAKAADARALARSLQGHDVDHARYLPLSLPLPASDPMIALASVQGMSAKHSS